VISNSNHIGPQQAFENKFFATPVPPPLQGILGNDTDLPNLNFVWTAGSIIACYFEAQDSGLVYQQNVKALSVAPGNRMRVAIYEKTNPDSGINLVLSPDIVNFGTTLVEMNFAQSLAITAGSEYWLVCQAENDCYYPYDSSLLNQYGFISTAAFGTFPASFNGIFTNTNILQFWANYTY